MMEALELGVERDYHLMDYIKSAEDKTSQGELAVRQSSSGYWRSPGCWRDRHDPLVGAFTHPLTRT
jgi:hypothetical protein